MIVYLNSPSKRVTRKGGDKVQIALQPAAIVRQRYRDGAGFTEVEFASSDDKSAVFPIKDFKYQPGEDPRCKPQGAQWGVQAPVFSKDTRICKMQLPEPLPPGTCPGAEEQGYCIAEQLAKGNLAYYFSQKPDFSFMKPFNQAALYTTWTASLFLLVTYHIHVCC